jgi:hypothetical protein
VWTGSRALRAQQILPLQVLGTDETGSATIWISLDESYPLKFAQIGTAVSGATL